MAVAENGPQRWVISVSPVGDLTSLLARLSCRAANQPVVLGVDFPLGLPRAYVARHLDPSSDFLAFLKGLSRGAPFFDVADDLADVGAGRPFYPRRGLRGITRLGHAQALGLSDVRDMSRLCDRATTQRPAGAPLFWTLGANQSGKSAISGWRDLLLPAFSNETRVALWPFAGPLCTILTPGVTTIAETYPADALRQIGLRLVGSKRRQSDRLALVPGIRAVMAGLDAEADAGLDLWLKTGFGSDPAGEDRLDCVLGVLCVLMVLSGRRPDTPPPDPWLTRWEGWVLGQSEVS